MTNKRFTEEDFAKWRLLKQHGMEIEHIVERVGASYDFVQRKIREGAER